MTLWRRKQTAPVPYAYERAIVSEIGMLLDFVAGSPNKTLRELAVPDTATPGATMPVNDVLCRLRTIESGLKNTPPSLEAGGSGFLLLVRDALNALIKPASGLTVAYTAMVVGNRRGGAVKSRAALAERAYAGLAFGAVTHRWGQRVLLALALLATICAAWDSAKVALGKSLIHNLAELRAKQADISREKVRLEETFAQPNAPTVPLFQLAGVGGQQAMGSVRLTVRLCERPSLVASSVAQTPALEAAFKSGPEEPALFESAAQQDVCDRDRLLGDSFFLAHKAIYAYMTDWPAVVGTGFGSVAQAVGVLGSIGQGVCARLTSACAPHPNPLVELANDPKHADSELLVVPVLLVLGNYVLPVIFALLGAAAFVILDFYGKLRDSLLAPRDHVLSWIQLVLGSVIGACIGLFFSAYGPPSAGSQADLIGALTLSASGVGFLAGFGVEGVFAMLEKLVKGVFGGESA